MKKVQILYYICVLMLGIIHPHISTAQRQRPPCIYNVLTGDLSSSVPHEGKTLTFNFILEAGLTCATDLLTSELKFTSNTYGELTILSISGLNVTIRYPANETKNDINDILLLQEIKSGYSRSFQVAQQGKRTSPTAAVISGDQTVAGNAAIMPITIVTPADGGGDPNYTVRWQSSSDGQNWSSLSANGEQPLQLSNLSATTYYRNMVTASGGPNGTESAYSNTVIVTVVKVPCINNVTSSNLSENLSYLGAYLSFYFSFSSGVNCESNLSDASLSVTSNVYGTLEILNKSSSYITARYPANLTRNTINDIITIQETRSGYSKTFQVVQQPGRVSPTPAVISGEQTMYRGRNAQPITFLSLPDNGGSSSYFSVWQESDTGQDTSGGGVGGSLGENGWVTILQADGNQPYSPGMLQQTTYIRHKLMVTDGPNGNESVYSNVVKVTVEKTPCIKTVMHNYIISSKGGQTSFGFSFDEGSYCENNLANAELTFTSGIHGVLNIIQTRSDAVDVSYPSNTTNTNMPDIITIQEHKSGFTKSIQVIQLGVPTQAAICCNQTIAFGAVPDSIYFSREPDGGGEDAVIDVWWEKSTDMQSWEVLSADGHKSYKATVGLEQTTHYRHGLAVIGEYGREESLYSTIVTVYVAPSVVGSCSPNVYQESNGDYIIEDACEIRGGCSSDYQYSWEQNNGNGWQAISGSSSRTLRVSPSITTSYRMVITSCNGAVVGYGNEAAAQIPLAAAVIEGSQTIMSRSEAAPVAIVTPSEGGCGNPLNEWWYSQDNGATWTQAACEDQVYYPGALTQTTLVKQRSVCSSTGENVFSNTITITVVHVETPGSIRAVEQVFIDSGIPELQEVAAASGELPYSYQWQQQVLGGAWANIAGATGADYTAASPISVTTRYRRLAVSSSKTLASNEATIWVKGSVTVEQQNLSDRNYIASYTPQEASSSIEEIADHTKRGLEVAYYDGLGRPIQTVMAYASPWKEDIVTPIVYDELGRQPNSYLPYAAPGAANGSYKPAAFTDQHEWYNNKYFDEGDYASNRRTFEPSPLSRVLKEYLPGGDAYATTATIDHTYTANANNEVRLWTAQGHNNQYYAPGTLYVHEVSDPDNRITRTYTDLQGRTVETRQLSPNRDTALTTSYAYDALGRLLLVIPPKAQTATNDEFNKLVYRYTYDNRGRCVEKKLPDSEPIYYIYDKADRLIMSQDGNQRPTNEWSVIKYDKFGRPVITGYLTAESTATRGSLQSTYGGTVVKEESTTGGIYGYTNNTGPSLTAASVLTVSYYDSDTTYLYSSHAQLAHAPQSGYPARYTNTTGQLVGTLVKRLDDSTKLIIETMYYDDNRRPIQTRNLSETGGLTVAYTDYNFTGQPVKGEVQHQLTTGGAITTEKYEYAYDHTGRLTALKHGVNATPTTLATYSYDELGRQQQKGLKNGNTAIETITYAYNIQQRLTDIQSPRFSQQLLYHTGTTPQYGGNISEARWTQYGNVQQAYKYTYDGFSRLLSGMHSGASPINTESQTYDANGNMLTIARSGTQAQSLNLTYSGNQLATVTGATTYAYDANGNMTKDGLRDMAFAYNRLNLPQTVSKGSDALAYGYSADGSKREKKFNNTITQQYRGSIVYDGSGTPEYVITPEGMVRNTSGTWVRQYNLADHLGNTRAVLSPNNGISQQTDYYPFGTAFSIANANKNKYLYSKNELQEEVLGGTLLGLYDFHARFYDPRTATFTGNDPLMEKYPNVGGRVYCNNNPLLFIDPEGTDWYIHIKTGNLRYFEGSDEQEGYMNVGKQVTIDYGNGTYHNFYQAYGISSKNTPVDAYQYLVDHPSKRTKAWKEGKISEEEKLEIVEDARNQARRDFATHPLVKATVQGIAFVVTGGIDLGFAAGKGLVGIISKGATNTGVKVIAQFSGSTIDDAVLYAMKHKANHIFGKATHNLNSLVTKLGGRENTIRAVLNAANGKLPASGVFENISVAVGGQNVLIRGSVVNGIPKLGTMFIP